MTFLPAAPPKATELGRNLLLFSEKVDRVVEAYGEYVDSVIGLAATAPRDLVIAARTVAIITVLVVAAGVRP